MAPGRWHDRRWWAASDTEAAAQRARTDVEAAWMGLAERRARDGEDDAGGVGARRSVTSVGSAR
jgi:hypothetical protein